MLVTFLVHVCNNSFLREDSSCNRSNPSMCCIFSSPSSALIAHSTVDCLSASISSHDHAFRYVLYCSACMSFVICASRVL